MAAQKMNDNSLYKSVILYAKLIEQTRDSQVISDHQNWLSRTTQKVNATQKKSQLKK